jgi:hypothetical protein
MHPLEGELTSTFRRYFPSPHLEVLAHDQNLQIPTAITENKLNSTVVGFQQGISRLETQIRR